MDIDILSSQFNNIDVNQPYHWCDDCGVPIDVIEYTCVFDDGTQFILCTECFHSSPPETDLRIF